MHMDKARATSFFTNTLPFVFYACVTNQLRNALCFCWFQYILKKSFCQVFHEYSRSFFCVSFFTCASALFTLAHGVERSSAANLPKTKPQSLFFTAITAWMMVYGMTLYNLVLATGSFTNASFLLALKEMWLEFVVIFFCAFFISSLLAKRLAFRTVFHVKAV